MRRWTLFLLLLASILNVIDRKLPLLLIEPIKRDLRLSDTQLGIITGVGFTAVYMVAGVVIDARPTIYRANGSL